MDHLISQVPSWVVTGIVGLVGIGVGWGFVKSEVAYLKEQTKDNKTRIEELAATRANFELKVDCQTFRSDCKKDTDKKFDDIKSAIEANREVVVDKFDEVKEFMGYVKRAIENINGK